MGNPDSKDYTRVADFYNLDRDDLETDWELFTNFDFSKKPTQPLEIVTFLEEKQLTSLLPRVLRLAKIFATIPATSCSAERSFSGIRKLKTYLRKTMHQERFLTLQY